MYTSHVCSLKAQILRNYRARIRDAELAFDSGDVELSVSFGTFRVGRNRPAVDALASHLNLYFTSTQWPLASIRARSTGSIQS